MTLGAYWTKTKTFQSIMFSTQYVRTLSSNDESDLAFAYHDRRKDFSGFMDRAIKLAKAFQLVDNGKTKLERHINGQEWKQEYRPKDRSKVDKVKLLQQKVD